jgi:hypothetical protein
MREIIITKAKVKTTHTGSIVFSLSFEKMTYNPLQYLSPPE